MRFFSNTKFEISRLVWQEAPGRKWRGQEFDRAPTNTPKTPDRHGPSERRSTPYKPEKARDVKDPIRDADEFMQPIDPAKEGTVIFGEMDKIKNKEFGVDQQKGISAEQRAAYRLMLDHLKEAVYFKGVANNWKRESILKTYEAQLKNLRSALKHKYLDQIIPNSSGRSDKFKGENPHLFKEKDADGNIKNGWLTDIDNNKLSIETAISDLRDRLESIRQNAWDSTFSPAQLEQIKIDKKTVDESKRDFYDNVIIPFYADYLTHQMIVNGGDDQNTFQTKVIKLYESCIVKDEGWKLPIVPDDWKEGAKEIWEGVPINPKDQAQENRILGTLGRYEREYYFNLKNKATAKIGASKIDQIAKNLKVVMLDRAIVENWGEDDLYDEYRKEAIELFFLGYEPKGKVDIATINALRASAHAKCADDPTLGGDNKFLVIQAGKVGPNDKGKLENEFDKIVKQQYNAILKPCEGNSTTWFGCKIKQPEKEFIENEIFRREKDALINHAIVNGETESDLINKMGALIQSYYKSCRED